MFIVVVTRASIGPCPKTDESSTQYTVFLKIIWEAANKMAG
jgi:hypothetical protein